MERVYLGINIPNIVSVGIIAADNLIDALARQARAAPAATGHG